jgi:hypothetical protein
MATHRAATQEATRTEHLGRYHAQQAIPLTARAPGVLLALLGRWFSLPPAAVTEQRDEVPACGPSGPQISLSGFAAY